MKGHPHAPLGRTAALALPLVLIIQLVSVPPAVADGSRRPLSTSMRTVPMSQALASVPSSRAAVPKKTTKAAAAASSQVVTQKAGGNKVAGQAVTASDKSKIVSALKEHQNSKKVSRFADIVPQVVVPQDVPSGRSSVHRSTAIPAHRWRARGLLDLLLVIT